jgi:hypothetical protein
MFTNDVENVVETLVTSTVGKIEKEANNLLKLAPENRFFIIEIRIPNVTQAVNFVVGLRTKKCLEEKGYKNCHFGSEEGRLSFCFSV